jgi:hypothetical protein
MSTLHIIVEVREKKFGAIDLLGGTFFVFVYTYLYIDAFGSVLTVSSSNFLKKMFFWMAHIYTGIQVMEFCGSS